MNLADHNWLSQLSTGLFTCLCMYAVLCLAMHLWRVKFENVFVSRRLTTGSGLMHRWSFSSEKSLLSLIYSADVTLTYILSFCCILCSNHLWIWNP